MKEFKKPDLNAPRFRPKKQNILNSSFYKKFVEKNPKYKEITPQQIKEVIKCFNGKIWNTVINYRDGIELPEQLGYLFLGSTPRQIGDNIDFKRSMELGYKVQNQNFESDQCLAKIFYTNCEAKYRFRFHQLWGFTGVRDFKRTVAKVFPENWKRYVAVAHDQKVSRLFRKEVVKDILKEQTMLKLETYDEFDFS